MPYPTLMNEEQLRERMNAALQRLRERGALRDPQCPSCGTENWNLDFVAIPSTPLPGTPIEVGPTGSRWLFALPPNYQSGYIPALAFVCRNCGYMKIHNLNFLGLWGA